jgi:hypothetical protein
MELNEITTKEEALKALQLKHSAFVASDIAQNIIDLVGINYTLSEEETENGISLGVLYDARLNQIAEALSL